MQINSWSNRRCLYTNNFSLVHTLMLRNLQRIMALKFIDIGANLTDSMFRGVYAGKSKHPDDMDLILERAWKEGMQKMIITVGALSEVNEACNLANKDERLFITIGCHPTRCSAFLTDPTKYYNELRAAITANKNKVVAIGECGLDYDRLHFCDKEIQQIYFQKQLGLAAEFNLPLFLHCRAAHSDFLEILERNRHLLENCGGAVVHSFDGTLEEAQKILSFSDKFYIGLNGCSLKTVENLNVVKEIPNERIMIETDCPWCGIRSTHAGYKYVQTKFPTVKKKEKWAAETLIDGRCEPCQIKQVLEVIAGVKEQSQEKLADIFYDNTKDLFFKNN